MKNRTVVFALGLSVLVTSPAQSQIGRKARVIDLNQAESILEDARVQATFDQYLAEWAPLDPEGASALGMHEYDYLLTARNTNTYRSLNVLADKYVHRLREETNPERLDRTGLLRYRTLLARLDAMAYEANRWDYRKKMPQAYLRLEGIFAILDGDYGSLLTRAYSALSRLEEWPSILAQGKASIERPPKLWTEEAILEAQAGIKALDALEPYFKPTYELNPDNEYRVKEAIRKVKAALKDYKTYLETNVLLKSDGKYAVGEQAFDYLLKSRHQLAWSNYKLLRFGEKAFKTALRNLVRAAREIDRKQTWETLYREALEEVPAPSDLKAAYAKEIESAHQHFTRQGIVLMPSKTVRINWTPAILTARVPAAAYDAPALLDDSKIGRLFVTPADPGLTADEKKRVLQRFHNPYAIRENVIREVWPGRHLENVKARHAASVLLRAGESSLMTEGWAQYAGTLAEETGYYSTSKARLVHLHNRLLAAARVVLDVKLHCGDWTVEQARKYLEEKVLLTPAESYAEVLLATEQPTLSMSGALGESQIVRLRERMEGKLKDQFTEREFHDRLLSYGNTPIPLIEKHLVKEWVRK